VDYEGNSPCTKAFIDGGAVTLSERVIQNGSVDSVVLYEDHGVMEHACDGQFGARVCKLEFDIHNKYRHVLYDED
jgi:hypothetical protein